jgi:hypothetical protein
MTDTEHLQALIDTAHPVNGQPPRDYVEAAQDEFRAAGFATDPEEVASGAGELAPWPALAARAFEIQAEEKVRFDAGDVSRH